MTSLGCTVELRCLPASGWLLRSADGRSLLLYATCRVGRRCCPGGKGRSVEIAQREIRPSRADQVGPSKVRRHRVLQLSGIPLCS